MVKGSVSVNRFYVIQPGKEVVIPGKVRRSMQDGVTALLTPAKTVFQRTGLLVCNIAVKTKERERYHFVFLTRGRNLVSFIEAQEWEF